MAVLETIDKKMSELKPVSPEELDRMTSVLKIVNSALEALDDDNKLIDYNFDIAINLVNQNVTNFGIIDLNKGIQDIKNVLLVKRNFGITDLVYSDEQKRVINSFKEKLNNYKKELELLIEKHSNKKQHKEIVENLEDLKKLIDGKGRRKYYTYEMLESLFEVVDYNDLSYKDIQELTGLLSTSKNKDVTNQTVTKEEVIDLLKEYLGIKVRHNYIEKHAEEICSLINLDNAKQILDFFKSENILDKFGFMGLVAILIKGRYEYIHDLYLNEILPNESLRDICFEDTLACIWVNEKRAERRFHERIRDNGEKEKDSTISSSIPDTSIYDVEENIKLLQESDDILSEKYDLSNITDLWVLTKQPWSLKKNIELFRLFKIKDVKTTAIALNDLEGKIHLAVELGLLNTPRNRTFREIEKRVPKNSEFEFNGKKKKVYSNSILNYFQRNTSQLARTSYAEYIYWFYKIQRSSKEEFYKIFFSDKRAGTRSMEGFNTLEDRRIYGNAREINKIIDENFADRFYSTIIGNYSVYEKALKDFNSSTDKHDVVPYYDESILEEELVQKLEEFQTKDIYKPDGIHEEEFNNPYSYIFGETIISRYKVLRNLTILRKQFGYINEDMILTAIAYNSYLSKNVFDNIRECIRRERVL